MIQQLIPKLKQHHALAIYLIFFWTGSSNSFTILDNHALILRTRPAISFKSNSGNV